MIVDFIENTTKYKGLSDALDKAFEQMPMLISRCLKSGRLEVDGDEVYANCLSYETSEKAGLWEVHRDYIDIHVAVEGLEIIQLADAKKLQLQQSYDEKIDAALYQGDPDSSILSEPGKFIVFFPGEVHRTAICAGYTDKINKMVIKVRI